MNKLFIALGGVALVALIFGGWIMGSYNGMVQQNEAVTTSWAQVETQYQRRFDLVPNLVAATKGAMQQEQKVFDDIAQARTHYAGTPSGTDAKVQAANQYEGALSRLLVVMESYPQLKSLENVKSLTDELAGTENRISVSRERYNTAVQSYNVSIKSFPRNVLAGMFGFQTRTFFESKEGADSAPTVNLEVK